MSGGFEGGKTARQLLGVKGGDRSNNKWYLFQCFLSTTLVTTEKIKLKTYDWIEKGHSTPIVQTCDMDPPGVGCCLWYVSIFHIVFFLVQKR